jgi:hypothetical protein
MKRKFVMIINSTNINKTFAPHLNSPNGYFPIIKESSRMMVCILPEPFANMKIMELFTTHFHLFRSEVPNQEMLFSVQL